MPAVRLAQVFRPFGEQADKEVEPAEVPVAHCRQPGPDLGLDLDRVQTAMHRMVYASNAIAKPSVHIGPCSVRADTQAGVPSAAVWLPRQRAAAVVDRHLQCHVGSRVPGTRGRRSTRPAAVCLDRACLVCLAHSRLDCMKRRDVIGRIGKAAAQAGVVWEPFKEGGSHTIYFLGGKRIRSRGTPRSMTAWPRRCSASARKS